MLNSSMFRMVVSIHAPHHVLATEDGIQQMLGFHTSEIVGQSILKLLGQKSDSTMFQSAIQSTANLESTKTQFTIYCRDGSDRKMMMATAPFYKDGALIGCHLTFRASSAITLQEAFEESNCPHTLVSAKIPHVISMINEEFSRKFGCSRSQALGQALGLIQGSDTGGWISLMRAACDGQVSRSRVCTRSARSTPDCGIDDVVCVPVVEAPNGKVRHVLVMFAPLLPPVPSPQLHSADPVHHHLPPPLFPDRASDRSRGPQGAALGTAQTASFFSCPNRRGFGPAIFPRRKVALDGSIVPALPVVVTPELLATLHDLPLHKAAEAIGVSATAFKKACRKLGVRRWTYKRRAGVCGRDADNDPKPDPDSGPGPARRDDPAGRSCAAPLPPPQTASAPIRAPNLCPSGPDFSAAAEWSLAPIHLKPLRPPADAGGRAFRQDWGRDSAAANAACRWAPGNGGEDCPGSPSGPAPLFSEPPAVDDSLVLDMLALQWPLHA